LVGDDVAPADVEGSFGSLRRLRTRDEVTYDIADGDGLDAVAYPPRRHHDRKALGEIPQHLEGGAAAAEDDRRPQHDGRHSAALQDPPDLRARTQVRGQRAVFRLDPAEVDEPPHPAQRHLPRDARRGRTIGGLESRSGQGMHEVVHDVHALDRTRDVVVRRDVTADHLDARKPRHIPQLVRRACKAPHAEPGIEQARHEPAADVSGRTRHQAQR
jgi:hypothetical protein